jgi:hypothetical protein
MKTRLIWDRERERVVMFCSIIINAGADPGIQATGDVRLYLRQEVWGPF